MLANAIWDPANIARVWPFLIIDCQGDADEWRVVTLCHACFRKLDIDAWITERIWQAIEPITPFEQLPKLTEAQ